MLAPIKSFKRIAIRNQPKPKLDNTPAMTSFISHITSVNRQGKDWLCSLKNGWRLVVSDSLMTNVAQSGK